MIIKPVYCALIATFFFWASSYPAIKLALVSYSPGSLALLRYLIASLIMLLVYLANRRLFNFSVKDIPLLILLGMVGIGLYNLGINYGQVTVSPAIASFIISIAPITTMIFAAIIWQEKVGLLKWTGILISLSGLVIIVLSSVGGVRLDYGVFYLLGSTLAASCFVLLQKPLLARYSPIVITAASIWGGSLLLAIYFPELLKQLPRASSQATLAVVYLGVFPAAIAYLCFSYALANLPVTQIAPYFYTMPIMTTLLSWLWLNEVPTLLAFSGGLLALSGVILAEQLPKIKAKKPRLTDKESA